MQQKNVLITDLDNTLFDWVQNWYEAFNPALDFFVKNSGLSRDEVIPEIKKIHQNYGTTEYENVFFELECFKSQFKTMETFSSICQKATDLRNEKRQQTLKLYNDVKETLITLKNTQTLLVVFTETEAYHSAERIKSLGLDTLVDVLFSPPSKNGKHIILKETKHIKLPLKDHYKPDPANLLEIIDRLGINYNDCVYLGDSLPKDVTMARNANITDVHAAYGESNKGDLKYKLLEDVTYWTEDIVKREKETSSKKANPTYVLEKSISEIFKHFDFVKCSNKVIENV